MCNFIRNFISILTSFLTYKSIKNFIENEIVFLTSTPSVVNTSNFI